MSGGFFRGTSADQDTRFSNKQAKLLKSHKFPPQLDHPVDMTKVKMDVMRPWIAHRVTELLGFEDEVLINFIYGLLDGEKVNGKEVQIVLTGFMEKNTWKFMKELWSLLLSAQETASGVPQQFLYAKEEETRKKMAETDRIVNEIQRKKEKEAWEFEQEKAKNMDGEIDMLRANNAALEPNSNHQPRDNNAWSDDDKNTKEQNGSRGRSRLSKSPHSADHSPSPPSGTSLRSISKSFSQSRSYSDERHRSRSISGPPEPSAHSISTGRLHHLSPRQSVSPRQRHSPRLSLSPSRHKSSHSRQRSTPHSHRISPSPVRRRLHSPMRHQSWSPMRRSPVRCRSRSPVWLRSRSPIRDRSRTPVRRRSQTPLRRKSRTPVRRRPPTPVRRRSPSPTRLCYRRSPSTPRRRSPSPHQHRSPVPRRRRSPNPSRYRSPSPEEWSSPSPVRRMSPSPITRSSKLQKRSSMPSPRKQIRTVLNYERADAEPMQKIRLFAVPSQERLLKDQTLWSRPHLSSRSPQRGPRNQNDFGRKVPSLLPSASLSPCVSESPTAARKRSASEDGSRSSSPYVSPVKQTSVQMIRGGSSSPPKTREHKPHHGSAETSVEEEEIFYTRKDTDQKLRSSGRKPSYSSGADELKDKLEKVCYKNEYSPEKVASRHSGITRSCPNGKALRKQGQETKCENIPVQQESPSIYKGSRKSERDQESYHQEGYKADHKNHSRSNDMKGSDQHKKLETVPNLSKKHEQSDPRGSVYSGSEESDKHKVEVKEKRKHKRSERKAAASEDKYSYDSEIEERNEAKRRRKKEKRLRKEERCRRREERRHRREERRSEKQKLKSVDTVSRPSDIGKNHDDC